MCNEKFKIINRCWKLKVDRLGNVISVIKSAFMIKRTLYFGNPAYLCKSNDQLKVTGKVKENPVSHHIPIEDIGLLYLIIRR